MHHCLVIACKISHRNYGPSKVSLLPAFLDENAALSSCTSVHPAEMALETCSARAKRPLPEGEWKSLEIGSQFISFIQVPDWPIAVKFQR